MKLPTRLVNRLLDVTVFRQPDEVIGGKTRSYLRNGHQPPVDEPYMNRWYIIPKNRLFNIYVHVFLRDDDDRALHDHPFWNLSILLAGSYWEHAIAAGGVHKRTMMSAGQWKFRPAKAAHRIELVDGLKSISLFLTGPTIRTWGFHCPTGWIPSKQFGKQGGCE